MKRQTEKLTALLLSLVVLLCACTKTPEEPVVEITDELFALTVRAGEQQDTLDPALSTCRGGETVLYHLYENLMRWVDDGTGRPALAYGQAASHTVEVDYAGNATYTFTLRDDIFWSDEKPVTAHHFVSAWRRIANPLTGSPYRELLSCISGYDQVQETGDSDLLGVYAIDSQTFSIQLVGCPPHFLEVLCAGAHTMPAPPTLVISGIPSVFNGPYVPLKDVSSFTIVKSGTYYDRANVTVDSITFIPTSDSETDYKAFLDGEADLVEQLPGSVLQEMAIDPTWTAEPVTSTCAVVLNTLQPPFDNADVRAAFRLAIDEQTLIEVLEDPTLRPAIGIIPYGVTDYGVRTAPENAEVQDSTVSEPETLPDPNAPIEEVVEEVPVLWDFRAHGKEIVTLNVDSDYTSDCAKAAALLSDAGYADGKDFPAVDYIYVDNAENKVIAEVLQNMWQEVLGVSVSLCPLSQEEYDLMLISVETGDKNSIPVAPYQMAAMELTADYNDAGVMLSRWHTDSETNYAAYSSAAFDILIGAAAEAVSPESYDAYLHDAEAILLQDAPVIPLCYRGTSYRLADDLEGLYRGPDGVYFFSSVTKVPAAEAPAAE